MSYPSLLEDHLLSRCPFYGYLSKRFSISEEISVRPTVSGLLQIIFYFIYQRSVGYCPVYRVFGSSLTLNFCLKVCLNCFTMAKEFHPDLYILAHNQGRLKSATSFYPRSEETGFSAYFL